MYSNMYKIYLTRYAIYSEMFVTNFSYHKLFCLRTDKNMYDALKNIISKEIFKRILIFRNFDLNKDAS